MGYDVVASVTNISTIIAVVQTDLYNNYNVRWRKKQWNLDVREYMLIDAGL